MKTADVIIIGGGIMGCALGYRLSQRGSSVIIIEKKFCGAEGSGRNSSGVRAQTRDPKELAFAIYSETLWESLSEELGFDVEYRRVGNLCLIVTEERLHEREHRVVREQAAGLPVRWLSIDEIKDMIPNVDVDADIYGKRILGGTFCSSDGTADPLRSTFAFAQAAKRNGVKIYTETEVIGFEISNNRITCVKTNRGDFSGEVVVNAAGAWAGEIGKMAGTNVPIKPHLCQVGITQKLPHNTLSPYMSIKPYGFWNQTAHGNLLVTDVNAPLDQFPRHDVGYDVIEFLCHCTAKMFSKINVGQLSLIRTYSGWNEASPDGCCMIGFARSPENFFVNAGYSGHGFCLGPASGIACADLILNGSTSVPVQELSYSRFDII